MNDEHSPLLLSLVMALPAAVLLTLSMIVLASRRGWVAKPKADRWHSKPTALFGGVAIFGTFALGCLPWLSWMMSAQRYDLLGLLAGAATIFAAGLRDDIKPLNPLVKLLGQVMAVMPFLVGLMLSHHSTAFIVSLPLIMFWMVLLTNSFNLLDNMDGLCGGTAMWTAALLMAFGSKTGQMPIAILSALCAIACWGFLVFNFRPRGSAQIFMGDCGSMFLGFLLAGLTVLGIGGSAKSPAVAFALPLLLMTVPLFDTTLVIIIRKREGRAISQGGRDHSSHRLVYAGLSEKLAVLALNGITLLCGLGGILAATAGNGASHFRLGAALVVSAIALARLGVYLNSFAKPRPAPELARLPEPAAVSLTSREAQIDTSTALTQK